MTLTSIILYALVAIVLLYLLRAVLGFILNVDDSRRKRTTSQSRDSVDNCRYQCFGVGTSRVYVTGHTQRWTGGRANQTRMVPVYEKCPIHG